MLFEKTRNAGLFSVAAFSRMSLPGKFLGIAAASVPAVMAQGAVAINDDWQSVQGRNNTSEVEDHFLTYNSTIPAESFEAIFRERQSV